MGRIPLQKAIAAFAFFFLLGPSVPVSGGDDPALRPRILILDSYHTGFAWSDSEIAGFLEAMIDSHPEIDIPIEHLDARRFFSERDRERIVRFLRSKYDGRGFDVVVAFDNPALELLIERRHELFPGVPVVFGGIGDHAAWRGTRGRMTGVAEIQDLENTIEIALRLHPLTRRLLILEDETVTGRSARRDAENVLSRFRDRVVYSFLPPSSFMEAQAFIASLPADTIVLIHSYSTDRMGRTLSLSESTRVFTARARVPVYAAHETRLGYGIVGGYLLSGREHGRRTAAVVRRVLSGENPDRIPVDVSGTSRPMFDHRLMERFGVPAPALPPGSVVINPPDDVLNKYLPFVAATAGVMATLVALVVFLALSIIRRRRAEDERERMRLQLIQAQKMEAVGRLAGGVAHDFNNTLCVIYGYAELALSQAEAGTPLTRDLEEIMKAATRSSDLIRQLLAFSRRQVTEPRVLRLERATAESEMMLRRLVGEDISVSLAYDDDLWPVKIDASQYNQILANLAANARDAMPGGGTLEISLDNVVLAGQGPAGRRQGKQGEFVRLSVRDSGVGMDGRTIEHIFDPFFTTKPVDRGTGLGLATVYAAVTDNGGHIDVESSPGRGSAFHVYLPRHPGAPEPRDEPESPAPARGGETVLLVEDEEQILSVTETFLQRQGYRVLAARRPAEALTLCASHRGPIDLLITDVIMPDMDGSELRKEAGKLRPGIKVLYMSGYTADIIEQRGIQSDGASFIQKPFRMNDLLHRVRELLDRHGAARP